jgi:hypothetical protein
MHPSSHYSKVTMHPPYSNTAKTVQRPSYCHHCVWTLAQGLQGPGQLDTPPLSLSTAVAYHPR